MPSAEGGPEPPVKNAHAAPEGQELDRWKTSVLAMIDKRIELYPRPWPNCRTPYEDIELGSSQDLNATGGLSEPSDEDFQKFEQELLLLRELQESCDAARVTAQSPEWSGIYPPYWPARIYASKALPDHLKILHGQVRSRYSLNSYTNKWLDFTKFKMNPYFQTVFARQLTESVEAYEFKLQSLDQIDNLIFGATPYLRTFVDLVGPMQLTQPPCKTIELRVRVPFQDPELLELSDIHSLPMIQ
ncbi:hypothetical protein BKA58DRAFT_397505 [Alternaria rosae]|uniref:uncharacterized protein n=1 Tax=Alternaria rosae TaxID=1187941 RepID=UPI001E8CFEC1|nr:uncharacterized protein BKA58DRAFT_397505 [Alternaria rosae]KAH6883303.1 hypothetical protein BKA58DRAFT_397505 [Alternaria rosae]